MKLKDKLKLIFLSVATLGIYPAVVFRKKDNKESNRLTVSENVVVNLVKLRSNLGGKKNILSTSHTHKKVSIDVESRKNINLEDIKNMKGISGVFASSTTITIIVGNTAKKIANTL